MARTTKPLTNTEVKQAKPKDKEYNLADGAGLFLRIKPNGTKSWLFNFSAPYTKKRTNISFGAYPDVSLAEARRQKEEARVLLAQMIDPKAHRDELQGSEEKKAGNTLERITYQWFELKKKKVTPGYADNIIRSLENHILPKLGRYPITEITAPRAIAVMKPMADQNKLESVKRLNQRLNEVMVYAVNTGLLTANPLAGIRHAFDHPQKGHMPSIAPSELPQLMLDLNHASIQLTTRCLIEWQLHTMTRPGEAAGTRWDEIDMDEGLWSISAERMKMRRGHVIPLTSQALALLEVMRPISSNSEYVFPSASTLKKHINESTANVALKRMGYGGRLVAHGMRSIASTALNEQGFDADVIESALAHVDKNEVRAAYNRAQYLERRRAVMEWWSDRIELSSRGSLGVASLDASLEAYS